VTESWVFELPGRPVSQKNSKRLLRAGDGRIIVANTEAVLAWREQAAYVLRSQALRQNLLRTLGDKKHSVQVGIKARLAVAQRIDVDNLACAPLDALKDAQVITDDKFVDDLHVIVEYGSAEPGLTLTISEREANMKLDDETVRKKGRRKVK